MKAIENLLHSIKNQIYIVLAITFTFMAFLFIGRGRNTVDDIQKGIADEIVRFHVIANSDTVYDQELKLKVRDRIIASLENDLKELSDKKEVESYLSTQLTHIEEMAADVIENEGYTYVAKASLEKCDFPTKVYGDLTFPAGTYDALRVTIGEAKGRNWWCVMYPPLCFVDSTYKIVPEDSKKELKTLLTEEEYDALKAKKKVKVKVKFKFLELFR